jgi:hypothetical protein
MISAILMISLGGAFAFADTPPAGETEAEPSNQRLICRSRPQIGSRIARTRVCKTAEEWRIYEADLEQSRRDINDRGARGCDLTVAEEC